MTSLSLSTAPQLPTELLIDIVSLSLPPDITKDESWTEHASLLCRYSLVSRNGRKIAPATLFERIVVSSARAANQLCRTLTGQYSERRDLAPLCKSLSFGRHLYGFIHARDLRFKELVTLMADVEELELRSLRDVVPWGWMRYTSMLLTLSSNSTDADFPASCTTELRQLRLERSFLVKSMGEGPPRVTTNTSHLLLVNTGLFAGALRPKAYPKLSFLPLGAYRAPHAAAKTVKSLVKDFAPHIGAFRADEYSMHLIHDWKPKWNSLSAYGVRLWLSSFGDGSLYDRLNLPQKAFLHHLYLEDPMLPALFTLNAWEAHATLVAELLEANPIASSLSAIKTIRLPGHPHSTGCRANDIRDLVARLATLGEEKDVSWTEEVEEGETDEDCGVWTKDDSFLRLMKSVDRQS